MSDVTPGAFLELAEQDQGSSRGRLTVFLGYAPGVGKTYSMLQSARTYRADGRDVAIGYLEPHARPETIEQAGGIRTIPPKEYTHGSITLWEPDITAIRESHPHTVLIDELAHSNAPGSLHQKRHEDVADLLEDGINVWTTVNIQHIDTLNDVVASITGVTVRETVPQRIMLEAAHVELVDIEPATLLERFRRGRVYRTDQAHRAVQSFFVEKNLFALRELALRFMAERAAIHSDVQRRIQAGTPVWQTAERVMVAIGGSAWSDQLIRAAQRLASSLRAPWVVVHLHATGAPATASQRQRIRTLMRRAKSAGAETIVRVSRNPMSDLLSIARDRNVTKLVLGDGSSQGRLKSVFRPSLTDRIIRNHGESIDLYLIRPQSSRVPIDKPRTPSPDRTSASSSQQREPRKWWVTTLLTLSIALMTALVADHVGLDESIIILIHVLGSFAAAIFGGIGSGLSTTVLGVLQFNFFFTEPRYTFVVDDLRYIPIFVAMFIVSTVTSGLSGRLRSQTQIIQYQQRQTDALLTLSQALSNASSRQEIAAAARAGVDQMFSTVSAVIFPDGDHNFTVASQSESFPGDRLNSATMGWTFRYRRAAGIGTDTMPEDPLLYQPLVSGSPSEPYVVGLLCVQGESVTDFQQLQTVAGMIASAIDRDRIAQEQRRIESEMEVERTRSSLLRSVSHDLRTPLAGIRSAAATLGFIEADPENLRTIAEDIEHEAERLSLMVDNVMNLTRLDSGTVTLATREETTDDLIHAAVDSARSRYRKRTITLKIADRTCAVQVDPHLIHQAMMNFVDNADRYSPEETGITIGATADDSRPGGVVRLWVRDAGPGVNMADRERIFERFVRLDNADDRSRGSGLGLAICRTIAHLHGGTAGVEPAESSGSPTGSVFFLELPASYPSFSEELDG